MSPLNIFYLVAFILIFIVGGWMGFRLSKFLRVWRMKRRFRRGREGEFEAREYLLSKGFRILAEQAEETAHVLRNDVELTYKLKVDFLVEKNGRTAAVEVKTGSEAVKVHNRDTRRQLLEYRCLYDIDDLYLYDADRRELSEIIFPFLQSTKLGRGNCLTPWLIAVNILLGLIILVLVKFF